MCIIYPISDLELSTDPWLQPPDPELKAVSVEEDKCEASVQHVADLAKHLDIDPYSEDEVLIIKAYIKIFIKNCRT